MSEEEIYKMLLTENVDKFPLLNEIFAIRNNKFKINDYTIYVTGCISLDVINRTIEKANLIEKQNKVIDLIFEKYYEYVCARPMSAFKSLRESGYTKCDKCEIEFDDKVIDCENCIREYFYKKVEEENE